MTPQDCPPTTERLARAAVRRLSRLLVWIILLASLALLGYGLVANWRELKAYSWHIEGWPLALAWLLFAVTLGIVIFIWRYILHRLGGNSTWRQDARIYCAANLAQRLPTPIWFLAGRVLMTSEIGIPKRISSLAVLLEWVAGFVGGLVTILALLPFEGAGSLMRPYAWALLLAASACLIITLQPRILLRLAVWVAARLGHAQEALPAISHRQMLTWASLWIAPWLVSGAMFCFLARAVYPPAWAHWPSLMLIWVAGGVVSRLSAFVPGGLLLREFTIAMMLSTLVPTSIAVVIALVARLWVAANDLFWFLVTARFVS